MTPLRNSSKGYRPSPEQELLLKGALLRGSTAVNAWNEWRTRVETDALDAPSQRLLALAWHNLKDQGCDPDSPGMKQARRYHRLAWGRNKMLFHELAVVLKALSAAGIPAMLLKGAALTLRYYKDLGLRPMGDLDILVPTALTEEAIRCLGSLGWKPMPCPGSGFTPAYRSVVPGHSFENAAGWELDLHWHVFDECCLPDDDVDLWQGAEGVDVGGVSTAVLNPADQLLHLCVHGMQYAANYPLHWVADAVTVLNGAGEAMDWDRLVAQVRRRRLVVSLTAALSYLRSLGAATVPTSVVERLHGLPSSPLERFEFAYRSKPFHRRLLGYMPLHWCRHSRQAGTAGLGARIRGFAPFLCNYFGIEHVRQVLAFLKRMAMLRLERIKRGS